MSNYAKNPDKTFYVGISTGLFTKQHADRMGEAIYIFAYLLSKVTGWDKSVHVGAVFRGQPITCQRIAADTGFTIRTIRRYISRLEKSAYIFTLRSPRGLKFYILNYKPLGKPNLKTGELPHLAYHKLQKVADHCHFPLQKVATHEGIYDHSINTTEDNLKDSDLNPNDPLYDIALLVHELFGVVPKTGEMRFFFRGYKHNKDFVDLETFHKALARTYMLHTKKMQQQDSAGKRPVGITNVIAYLNSGLHGRIRYLLRSKIGEQPIIEFVQNLHNRINKKIAEERSHDTQAETP